ncbi:MAG: DUF933 domain-containing protein [Endomicrobiales bacterium]
MNVGIIGLEYAGKKSLFSLLTGIKGEGYARGKEEIGVIDVPDERIDHLARYYKTEKKVYSKIEFHLIPSLKKEAEEKSKALIEAREVDMFAIVLRQFSDESVFHPLGTVDVLRDYAAVKDELIFADLYLVETRLERLEKQLKSKKTDLQVKERDLMLKLRDWLEKSVFLNAVPLDADSARLIRSLPFLTLKPIFVVVNVDEDKLGAGFSFPDGVKSINIAIKIESEIQQLDENGRKEFLETLGLKETSLNRLIQFAYRYGDLISFITAGVQESHSWTIKNGATAHKAAGVIHSDIEKGFIRAEIISYDDFVKAGSEAEAKKLGLYRLEGKEYIVKDGDIIEFRFNI